MTLAAESEPDVALVDGVVGGNGETEVKATE